MGRNADSTEDSGVPDSVEAKRPLLLKGLRVVEFGRFVSGPYASRLLADAGADVTKLETLDGDPFRTFGGKNAKFNSQFIALNRNKHSLSVDTRSEAGEKLITKVLDSVDVFIENSRPGSMERLGLGYETLKARNPRLIYCSITGAGKSGPYATRPAYDMVGQALSGFASQLIDPFDPRPMGPNLSDSLTGLTAAYAILAALHHRELTGLGQLIEVDMVSAGLALLGAEAQILFETGVESGPYSRPANSSSFVITCGDGKLIGVHLSSVEKFWLNLVDAIGAPELNDDDRFNSRQGRIHNFDELRQVLIEKMSTKPLAYWLEMLNKHDVPCAPVHNISETLADPDLKDLHLRQQIRDDNKTTSTLALPFRVAGARHEPMSSSPELGDRTVEILREQGISEEEIQELIVEGIILKPSNQE